MPSVLDFRLALAALVCVLALGCGGRAQDHGGEADQGTPETRPAGSALQDAVDGLANSYRALCACEAARSSDGSCNVQQEFEGYDPAAVRETLERHAERGDGFTECIRDIVLHLSACLSAEHGCDVGACPHAASLLDDGNVLGELGESCASE
jgi:hypothetical protein